jgi:hypothetical protein
MISLREAIRALGIPVYPLPCIPMGNWISAFLNTLHIFTEERLNIVV